MLRSWARLRRGLPCFVTPRKGAPGTAAPAGVAFRFLHRLQGSSAAWVVPPEEGKDRAVPNPSWSQEMVRQFNRYMEMTKDGTWWKVPFYRNFSDHFPEGWQKPQNREHRFFLRSTEEGLGFECAMFLNRSDMKAVTIFQPGPYLEGHSGFVHGGAIATILDTALGGSILSLKFVLMTVNLNINYKSPVALGSVVLVDTRVDKIEDKKVFVSGEMRSVDGQTLHAESTGEYRHRLVPQPKGIPKLKDQSHTKPQALHSISLKMTTQKTTSPCFFEIHSLPPRTTSDATPKGCGLHIITGRCCARNVGEILMKLLR